MRRLRDTMAVNCPCDQATARIEEFLAACRGGDGKVRLHLALGREVCVEVRTNGDRQSLCGGIWVSWETDCNVSLPPFAGTLMARAERNPEITFIELDGIYDDSFGRKNVQSAAKELLAQIAAAIGTPVS